MQLYAYILIFNKGYSSTVKSHRSLVKIQLLAQIAPSGVLFLVKGRVKGRVD